MTCTTDEIHPADDLLRYLRGLGRSSDEAVFEYHQSGYGVAQVMLGVLRGAGLDLERARILDFAAGFGRVTRHYSDFVSPEQVAVAEIDPRAVEFQSSRFGFAGHESQTDPEALAISESFDAVLCFSLFTHLPRTTFGAWLRKLADLVADDGILVFTTHAIDLYQGDLEPDADGFLFNDESESTLLETAEYGSTFTTQEFVERAVAELGDNWGLLGSFSRCLNGLQVLHVARRSGTSDALGVTPLAEPIPPYACFLDILRRSGEFVEIAGWACSPIDHQPAKWFRIMVDGAVVAEGPPTYARPDVAEHLGVEGELVCGFGFRFPCKSKGNMFSIEFRDERDLGFRIYRYLP